MNTPPKGTPPRAEPRLRARPVSHAKLPSSLQHSVVSSRKNANAKASGRTS